MPEQLTTREEFLAARSRRRFKTVPIGAFQFRIRSLTSREFAEIDAAQYDQQTYKVTPEAYAASRRLLVVRCVVDAEGNPLLTDADVEALEDTDSEVAETLMTECWEFVRGKAGQSAKN
jgi:hypothetical protein